MGVRLGLLALARLDILLVLEVVEIFRRICLSELIVVGDVVLGLEGVCSYKFYILVHESLRPQDIVLVEERFVVVYPADPVVVLTPLWLVRLSLLKSWALLLVSVNLVFSLRTTCEAR